jgi:hypothetical protein
MMIGLGLFSVDDDSTPTHTATSRLHFSSRLLIIFVCLFPYQVRVFLEPVDLF